MALRSEDLSCCKAFFLYFNCFFVTVAAILGTGILGLPVKLSESGFFPFLATFCLCCLMQTCVVIMFVDTLQRAEVQLKRKHSPKQFRFPVPSLKEHSAKPRENLLSIESRESGALQPVGNEGDGVVADEDVSIDPDLHRMGKQYLGHFQAPFSFFVMFHFLAIMITYGLAGPQGYGLLLGLPFEALIAPFCIIYALLVVFFAKAVQPIVSLLTVAKTVLLVFMIAIVGLVGSRVEMEPHDDWGFIVEPLLLGTVALGGVVNVMPVMYSQLPRDKKGMQRFRLSVVMGVVMCWILNIFWAFFVLEIVPQTNEDAARLGTWISLEEAEENGQISTVPIIEIIELRFPQFHWISLTVTFFIVLSITVSYVAIGTGMKHVLDGMVSTWEALYYTPFHRARATGRQIELSPWTPREALSTSPTPLEGEEEGEGGDGEVDTSRVGGEDRSGNDRGSSEREEGSRGGVDEDRGAQGDAAAREAEEIPSDLDSSPQPRWNISQGDSPRDYDESVPPSEADLVSPSSIDVKELEGGAIDVGSIREPKPVLGNPVIPLTFLCCCSAIREPLRRIGQTPRSRRYILYLYSFTFIMIVALLNPKGFVVFLEVVESLAINVEAGLFIGLLFFSACRDKRLETKDIYLPLSRSTQGFLFVFSMVTFGGAILYDITKTIFKVAGWMGLVWTVVWAAGLVVMLVVPRCCCLRGARWYHNQAFPPWRSGRGGLCYTMFSRLFHALATSKFLADAPAQLLLGATFVLASLIATNIDASLNPLGPAIVLVAYLLSCAAMMVRVASRGSLLGGLVLDTVATIFMVCGAVAFMLDSWIPGAFSIVGTVLHFCMTTRHWVMFAHIRRLSVPSQYSESTT